MAGDVIVRLGDKRVSDLRDLSNILKAHTVGDSLVIVFLRDGSEQVVEAVLTGR